MGARNLELAKEGVEAMKFLALFHKSVELGDALEGCQASRGISKQHAFRVRVAIRLIS